MSIKASPSGRVYGWRPDLPNTHAPRYTISAADAATPLPPSVDLRALCAPVVNQGELGSCTANSIAGLLSFCRRKHQVTDFPSSRLFIYYNERSMEGTVNQDAGAAISDGIKVVSTAGAPPETDWPYVIAQFKRKPPARAYTDAKPHRLDNASRLDNTNLIELKTALALGDAFVFGFTVYSSFESQTVAQTGVVPMPAPGEQVLGGHAVMAVGYDDAFVFPADYNLTNGAFLVRNSWGTDWGQGGYFRFPYAYLTNPNLADDAWSGDLAS
jgi:C1A family cysteine protease